MAAARAEDQFGPGILEARPADLTQTGRLAEIERSRSVQSAGYITLAIDFQLGDFPTLFLVDIELYLVEQAGNKVDFEPRISVVDTPRDYIFTLWPYRPLGQ